MMPSNDQHRTGSEASSSLTRDVGEAIVRLAASIQTAFGEATAGTGLTQLEARLLRAAASPMSQGEMAAQLGVDAARVSTLARGLEARGLLRRTAGRGDRRVRRSELTPAGRVAVSQVGERLAQLSPLPGGLDDDQLAALRDLLTALEAGARP